MTKTLKPIDYTVNKKYQFQSDIMIIFRSGSPSTGPRATDDGVSALTPAEGHHQKLMFSSNYTVGSGPGTLNAQWLAWPQEALLLWIALLGEPGDLEPAPQSAVCA